MRRRSTLIAAITLAGLTCGLAAPAAGAQGLPQATGFIPGLPAGSSLPQVPAGSSMPTLEQAPAWTPVIPGLPTPPALTFPVIAPQRPTPEYGSVGVYPTNGEVVGVAQPIMFRFDRSITDRARAEQTIGVRTAPPVAGKYYWINDREVRWRPLEFWPVNSSVTIWAAGRQQAFRTGDALVADYDDRTHTITVTRNGQVVRTMKASAGDRGWETYNGVYYTGQRGRAVRMNSATFGLRPEDGGYDAIVNDAIRLSYDGIYIHSAPWSLADQGVRNVSNGCINVSPADAAWYYDNTRNGDPLIVRNGPGRPFGAFDGQGDWNY